MTPDVLRAGGREGAVALLRIADERLLRIHDRYLAAPAVTIVAQGESV